jgi:hypothetical protein
LTEQCGDCGHLVIPADDRRRRHGKVRTVERPDRWEVALAELVDALRGLQVLEAMIAEIHQRESLGVDLLDRRKGHEDLSAAPGGRDPGGPVHIGAHAPLGRSKRGARVDPDTHPDGPGSQRTITVSGGFERTVRRAEREEEGVTLRVDLDAAMPSEGFPEHAAVLGQGVRVGALTQLVQKSTGTFDVREQERHRSRGQVGAHDRTVVARRARVTMPANAGVLAGCEPVESLSGQHPSHRPRVPFRIELEQESSG